jgi:hypothetical protein
MEPPSAQSFFLDEPKPQLSQGDIVLAPTVEIWSEKARAPLFMTSNAPDVGGTSTIALWDDYAGDTIPIPVAEVRWSPAMVLSHDCEIDKEFNRERERLVAAGYDEDHATAEASENETLDPHVLLSPLLPYEEAPIDQHSGIRSGGRIAFFPVPPSPIFDDEEFFADLGRICTVERKLVLRYRQLASIGGVAAGVLRYKLSEALASRDLATLAELQAIVGQQITGLEIESKTKKSTALIMHLGDGTTLHMEIRTPRESLRSVINRIIPGRT